MLQQLGRPAWGAEEATSGVEEWVRDELDRRVALGLRQARAAPQPQPTEGACYVADRGYAAQHAAQRRPVPMPGETGLPRYDFPGRQPSHSRCPRPARLPTVLPTPLRTELSRGWHVKRRVLLICFTLALPHEEPRAFEFVGRCAASHDVKTRGRVLACPLSSVVFFIPSTSIIAHRLLILEYLSLLAYVGRRI